MVGGSFASNRHDAVVLYAARPQLPDHEAVVHQDIALRLADLMDVPFDGTYTQARHGGKRCYFVPSDTLITPALRQSLGITSESDLFGGYADYPFMPTKAITHGLVGPHATRPDGWSDEFCRRVRDATLPGYTAFSRSDLTEAAQYMLAEWPAIRLKPVRATAGRGQQVITDLNGLEKAIEQLDHSELGTCGVVLEVHLDDVATFSVGQVRLQGLIASYIGTQRLTRDNHGHEVYGGSRLRFVRGGFDALKSLPLDNAWQHAIELAKQYDTAADECYPGFFASRRNYDVAAGTDPKGDYAMGVLEQSWRIGGASRAEIAALEVLAADPKCKGLWAETREVFGDRDTVPDHAVETYSGEDPCLGLIRKYVMVEAYGDQQ